MRFSSVFAGCSCSCSLSQEGYFWLAAWLRCRKKMKIWHVTQTAPVVPLLLYELFWLWCFIKQITTHISLWLIFRIHVLAISDRQGTRSLHDALGGTCTFFWIRPLTRFLAFTAFQLAPAGDVSQQEEAASVADGTLWPPQRLLQWQDLHSLQGKAPGNPLQEPHLHRPDREGLQPQLARRHKGLHLHQGESHVSPGITAPLKPEGLNAVCWLIAFNLTFFYVFFLLCLDFR